MLSAITNLSKRLKEIGMIFIIGLLFISNAAAQAPNWLWAKNALGGNLDVGNDIATDANGNVYVTGTFKSSSILFGGITLTNTNTAYGDLFIVKYNAFGNVLWAKNSSGDGWDEGLAIAIDDQGNIYITGTFTGDSITFDGTVLFNTLVGDDIFIAKYNNSGNVLWAKSAGGLVEDRGFDIVPDVDGNVYVTGDFRSNCSFGNITLNSTGDSDFFIAKYDSSGNIIWAQKAGGSDGERGTSITTDENNNIYATGFFQSSTMQLGTTTFNNAGDDDVFIAKYDSSGNILWAHSAGGGSFDYCNDVTTDSSSNVYIVGGFESNSITFGSTTLLKGSGESIYIVKYDSAGNFIWAHNSLGNGVDEARGITNDAAGNLYVTGYFSSDTITFGSSTLTNVSSPDYDVFVTKYDNGGNVLWANSAGGIDFDQCRSIISDGNGNLYITGLFVSPFISFGNTTLFNSGSWDVFVAKISDTWTDVTEVIITDQIIVYPIPTDAFLNIQFPSDETRELQIINHLGQTVYSTKVTSAKHQVDLSTFSAGMYALRSNCSKSTVTKSFIISK